MTEELVYKSRVQPLLSPSLPPPPPQILNFYFLFCKTVYLFVLSFWITVFIILFEGMLGGAVYANAFYSISVEVRHSINPLSTT